MLTGDLMSSLPPPIPPGARIAFVGPFPVLMWKWPTPARPSLPMLLPTQEGMKNLAPPPPPNPQQVIEEFIPSPDTIIGFIKPDFSSAEPVSLGVMEAAKEAAHKLTGAK